MGIKKFRPTSPAIRFKTVHSFEEVTSPKPEKSLVVPLKRSGGRNCYGRVTAWHRGGGHKRQFRVIDFKRDKREVPAKVASIEYDPNRSARIALLHYADGEKRYILAPNELRVGDQVISSPAADIKPGNSLPLRHIPSGTSIHNVELKKGAGGQLARSAGASVQLLAREGDYATLRLNSFLDSYSPWIYFL
jgi:large subunit ribosomal protein L2